MKSDQTVQCDVLTHCAHLYMLYVLVFCSHHLPTSMASSLPPSRQTRPTMQKLHGILQQEPDLLLGEDRGHSHRANPMRQEPEVVAELNSVPIFGLSNASIQDSLCIPPQATCDKRRFLWQSTSARSRNSSACQRYDPHHLCTPVNHSDSQVTNASRWEFVGFATRCRTSCTGV